jgi:hypothetical protein
MLFSPRGSKSGCDSAPHYRSLRIKWLWLDGRAKLGSNWIRKSEQISISYCKSDGLSIEPSELDDCVKYFVRLLLTVSVSSRSESHP